MPAPDVTTKVRLLSDCLGIVVSSPEAWRTFEHEQQEKPDGTGDESFEDWALRKAEPMAKNIWKLANQ